MAKYSLLAHDVLKYLGRFSEGKEKARPLNLIRYHLNQDRRNVELAIEELRDAGVPVCSSCSEPKGMYLALTYKEALPWVKQIDNRFRKMAIHRANALRALRRLAEAEGIQCELELEMDVIDQMKDCGWKSVKTESGWRHLCAACAEEA